MGKKLVVFFIVGVLLSGCSSSEDPKKGGKSSQPKKVVGIHDEELAKKGIVRDKNGNFGEGSFKKALGGDR